jgi:hypothetical protein
VVPERRFALMKIEAPSGPPSLRQAADILGVGEGDLDQDFGVIPVDPAHDTYCVQVDERALEGAPRSGNVEGPFSNPPIEPFGPDKSG